MAGEPLRVLLKKPRKMLSSALLSMLAKKGASSMAGKGIEFTGEKDFEETSKLKCTAVNTSGSVEMVGDACGTPVGSIAARISERKRTRRVDVEEPSSLVKKSKGVIKLRGVEAGKSRDDVASMLESGGPVQPSGDEAFSAVRAAASAKDLLDQVCVC